MPLLERAARDGHTGLPVSVVTAAGVGRADAEAALASGEVVGDGEWLALEPLATAEAALADELLGLAEDDRLAVVLGLPPEGADVDVVADAHRRSLADLAAQLQGVPHDRRVVLCGDPAVLPGPAPGAVVDDVVAWGAVPVRDLRPDGSSASCALDRLPAALRRGELPEPDRDDRSVVVVPCASDDAVAQRVVQLAGDSLPRVFGVAAGEVLVVSPVRRGVGGADSLGEALAAAVPGVRVLTVHEAAAESGAPAVVACFPGQAAGALTRALVASSVALAGRHLSVVTAAGDALPRAVAADVRRPRRTRLGHLLRSATLVGHHGAG